MTPPLFYPNFGVFPLDQITDVGFSPSMNLKLFGSEVIFEVSLFQAMWSRYMDVTDGQTTYCGITALCVASRGKNERPTGVCVQEFRASSQSAGLYVTIS